jgi:hypothetical protein
MVSGLVWISTSGTYDIDSARNYNEIIPARFVHLDTDTGGLIRRLIGKACSI